MSKRKSSSSSETMKSFLALLVQWNLRCGGTRMILICVRNQGSRRHEETKNKGMNRPGTWKETSHMQQQRHNRQGFHNFGRYDTRYIHLQQKIPFASLSQGQNKREGEARRKYPRKSAAKESTRSEDTLHTGWYQKTTSVHDSSHKCAPYDESNPIVIQGKEQAKIASRRLFWSCRRNQLRQSGSNTLSCFV